MTNVTLVPPGWEEVASYAAKHGEMGFIAALATMDLELAEEEFETYFEPDPEDGGYMEDSIEACRVRLSYKDAKEYYFHHPTHTRPAPLGDGGVWTPRGTALVAGDIRANLERLQKLEAGPSGRMWP